MLDFTQYLMLILKTCSTLTLSGMSLTSMKPRSVSLMLPADPSSKVLNLKVKNPIEGDTL